MQRRTFLILGSLTLCFPSVVARAQHSHSHSHEGKNGGRVVEAGDFHVELVTKNDVLDIYLSDEDEKPISPTGFKAIAIFASAGKSQRVPLEPADDKRLSGKAATALTGKFKGAVQITPPGKKAFTAKFD